jgi:hypothetical protein
MNDPINKFNIDLAQRIHHYQQEILKQGENPKAIRDSKRELKMKGGSRSDYVRPNGNVHKLDEEVLAVNVSQAELAGGRKKINRLNKAKRWTGFSTDTAREGIGLTDEAWTVYDKHDAKSQAMKKAFKMTGSGNMSQVELDGGRKKINRLNKAKRWTGFSTDTAREGIGLTDEAWSVYDKHDPKSQAMNKAFKMTGSGNMSKKKLHTAVNNLQAYMEGKRKTKPTKLQLELLKSSGIIESTTEKVAKKVTKAVGSGMPRKPNPRTVIVTKVMKERGVSLMDASKIVKAEGLYVKKA